MLAAEAGGAETASSRTRRRSSASASGPLPVADLVFDERGALRPLVNVHVDGIDVHEREGLCSTRLEGGETIGLVAAVAGGSS